MKKAAIMARQSSDEQAKGYGLDSQMEQLKKHCEHWYIVFLFRKLPINKLFRF